MSAAAARHRKQLAARKAAGVTGESHDMVYAQLSKLLQLDQLHVEDADLTTTAVAAPPASMGTMDEATAYEALQLAQSVVRKKVHAGQFTQATDVAYQASLSLLRMQRISVATQLLSVLVDVLLETHTVETPTWLQRIIRLHQAYVSAMQIQFPSNAVAATSSEAGRLHRLQKEWLRRLVQWSCELGTQHYGHPKLHAALGQQCWILSQIEAATDSQAAPLDETAAELDEEIMDLQCEAVQHMALAEQPMTIIDWLATLPAPTSEQIAVGHACPPAVRDALVTRAVLVLCAVENLRDANILVRSFLDHVETTRTAQELAVSYTSKDDGMAPSHIMFCSMLLRICEMEARTGPLYSWLLRSFKWELDRLYKPQAVSGYTTRIGKIYFDIQPPPNMLSMMENMMSMMSGGGFGGGGGGGGIDPAAMQAALAAATGGAGPAGSS